MKLNIQTIYEHLDINDCTLISQQKTDFLIDGVRLYTGNQRLCPNYIYILTASQLEKLPIPFVGSFICIGFEESYDFSKSSSVSLIRIPEKTDACQLLETVTELFEKLNRWEKRACELILKKAPLQEVLDFCKTMLKNPFALFDNQQSLILKCGDIDFDRIDSIWKHVLKTGLSPEEAPSSYLAEQLHTSPYPFFYNSDNQFRHINRMIVRVMKDNSPFGCLSMTDISSPFSATEYSILFYTARITELHLTNSDEFKSYCSDIPWFLTQLFQGISLDDETIRYNTSLLGIRPDTPYQLWTFTSLKNIDLYQNGGHLRNVKRLFNTSYAYVFHNQIIVLYLNPPSCFGKKQTQDLQAFLSQRDLKCACSMTYHAFSDIYSAFLQCQTLLATSFRDETLYLDFHSSFPILIKNGLGNQYDIQSMLYPNINKLQQKSKGYGTELLICLKSYVINGQNVSMTAKSLGVHRHTVIYRLDRINEVLHVDWEHITENSLIQIYLSCLLLLND